jgi:hypothetical protein
VHRRPGVEHRAKALREQLALGEARLLAAYVRANKTIPKTRDEDFHLLRVEVTCTDKDPELPPKVAFARSLELLTRTTHHQRGSAMGGDSPVALSGG